VHADDGIRGFHVTGVQTCALPISPLAALHVPTPGFADRRVNGETWRTYTLRFGDHYITTADRTDERATLVRDVLLAAGVPFLVRSEERRVGNGASSRWRAEGPTYR